MASELYVETLKGLTSGDNANKVIIPSGQTLDASAGGFTTPAGHVIQVAQDTNYAQTVVGTSSWMDTPLSVTMTPSSTSSKFIIMYAFGNIYFPGNNRGVAFRIDRNGSSLFTPSQGYAIWNNDGGGDHKGYSNIFFDESSHTLAALTFKLQVRGYNSSAVDLNDGGAFKDTLIVQEVAA